MVLEVIVSVLLNSTLGTGTLTSTVAFSNPSKPSGGRIICVPLVTILFNILERIFPLSGC